MRGNRSHVFFYFSFRNTFSVSDYSINIKKGTSAIFKKKVISRTNNFELIRRFDGWSNLITFVHLLVHGSRIHVALLAANNANFKILRATFKFPS